MAYSQCQWHQAQYNRSIRYQHVPGRADGILTYQRGDDGVVVCSEGRLPSSLGEKARKYHEIFQQPHSHSYAYEFIPSVRLQVAGRKSRYSFRGVLLGWDGMPRETTGNDGWE